MSDQLCIDFKEELLLKYTEDDYSIVSKLTTDGTLSVNGVVTSLGGWSSTSGVARVGNDHPYTYAHVMFLSKHNHNKTDITLVFDTEVGCSARLVDYTFGEDND